MQHRLPFVYFVFFFCVLSSWLVARKEGRNSLLLCFGVTFHFVSVCIAHKLECSFKLGRTILLSLVLLCHLVLGLYSEF